MANATTLDEKYRDAVFGRDFALIDEMIAAGQLEARDSEGNTPLACACAGTKYDVAKYLLEKGAFPDAESNIGNTPMMLAALVHQDAIVKLLISHGADVNKWRKGGETALMMAVCAGDTASAVAIVDAGANILHQCARGYDAMGMAHLDGYPTMDPLIRKAAEERDARRQREEQEKAELQRQSRIEAEAAGMANGLSAPVQVRRPLKFMGKLNV
jgi:hypothetical protein